MKNINKRTKMIFATVGVLVIVVVSIIAGVVMTQSPVGGLFGAAVDLVIAPSNPTLLAGTMTYLYTNSASNCVWYTSDKAVVSFDNSTIARKLVRIQANQPGQAAIRADCGVFGVNRVSTTVTVVAESTSAPLTIWLSPPDQSTLYVTKITYVLTNLPDGYTCQNWSSTIGVLEVADNTRSATLDVAGVYGTGTVSMQCDTPTGMMNFSTSVTHESLPE